MTETDKYQIPWRFLIVAFLINVTLGVLYLRGIREVPQYRIPVLDEWSYDSKAMGLLDGTWPGRKVFYQDPLYPYFLAFIYRIIGHRVVAVKFFQVFLGGLNVLLIYGIARRIFGRGTGIVAALIATLYKPLFFYEGILSKEILSLFLTDACLFFLLWAQETKKAPRLVLSGVFLGLTCLTRANLILLVPIWALWRLFSTKSDVGLKRGLIMASAFCIGCIAAISPVTIHNLRSGDYVLMTSQGGQNFYIGNHPDNQTGSYIAPPFLRPHPMFEEDDFRSEAMRRAGRAMKPSQLSRFWYSRSMDYVRSQPRQFFKNLAHKTAVFFNDFEPSDNVNYYFYKENFSYVLKLPLLTYGAAAVLGVFGWLALAFRKGRGGGMVAEGGWLLIFFLPIYAASTIAYYIFGRYRVPVLTALIPLSAFGLMALWKLLAERKSKRFIQSLVLIAVLCPAAYWPMKKPVYAGSYYMLGDGYRQLGRFAEAERAFRMAMILKPGILKYRLNLGLALDAQGRHEDAGKEFEAALALFPTDSALREALGNVYSETGRPSDAVTQYQMAIKNGADSPIIFYNLGMAYKKLGFKDKAQLYFKHALEKDPRYKPALAELY